MLKPFITIIALSVIGVLAAIQGKLETSALCFAMVVLAATDLA